MKTKELEKYPLQILMMTLTSFLTLLIPKLLSYLIDDILMANNKEKILPWFMITFGVTSLLMIMKFYFITYNPIKIGIKNTFRLQIKAAKDILNMNQSVYADEDKGYYYNVCSNSCAAYGDLYEEIHLNLISCFIYVCGILAVVFMTNIYLGIFFIVYGIVLIIVSLNISKPLFDMQKNVMVKQDRYLNGIRNIIENKIGINALHREKFFADEYKQNIVPYEKHVLRYRFLECLCRQAPNILDQVCLVVFLFIGGNLVLNQQISIGEFLMMYQYMAYFSDPITTACAILMRYRANMVHVARIDKLSDDAKIPKETKKYMTNTENLFFTEKYDFYKGKEKTDFLFHIDKLKIKKGGFILTDEMDEAAFLTYPIFTVDGDFMKNMYEIPIDKELMHLLQVDFSDKEILSNPVNLSYGQQQKLALLRVFGLNSPILFLDEPLSNLDKKTQENVVAYIRKLKGEKTILVVMHSDELDEAADSVIYIENKKLIQK